MNNKIKILFFLLQILALSILFTSCFNKESMIQPNMNVQYQIKSITKDEYEANNDLKRFEITEIKKVDFNISVTLLHNFEIEQTQFFNFSKINSNSVTRIISSSSAQEESESHYIYSGSFFINTTDLNMNQVKELLSDQTLTFTYSNNSEEIIYSFNIGPFLKEIN